MKYFKIKEFARKLRNHPTPAEALLWKYIRGRQLMGRRFLRQHPVLYQFDHKEYFYFIPDFYCYQEKLIIELDGRIHEFQIDQDKKRQAILEAAGYRIIRFKNRELKNMGKVLSKIKTNFN